MGCGQLVLLCRDLSFNCLVLWLLRPNHGLLATRNLVAFPLLGPTPLGLVAKTLGASEGKAEGLGSCWSWRARRREHQTVVVKDPEAGLVRPLRSGGASIGLDGKGEVQKVK